MTVNVVLPGRIHTASRRRGWTPPLPSAPASRWKTSRPPRPPQSGRLLRQAARVRRRRHLLASTRASYVTGSRIRIDGGAIKGI
ncbi:MAG: hypothetical protein HPM95_20160 [Alphaproteobacteria bacterium]|nr:hypothetical protein [Alphaproteobacteria bacterium]